MNYQFLAAFLLAAISLQAVERDEVLAERLDSVQATFIEGINGWRFLPAEIKHLLVNDLSKDSQDPFEAIVDFNEQLKRLGVRLLLVPVPAKVTIHPEFLDSRLKGQSVLTPEASFYDSLRAKGVEVIDLTQEFASAKANGPLYCERDTHWNGRAIVLTAQKLAERIKDLSKDSALEAKEEPTEIQGDLGGDKEKIALRFIHPQGQSGRLEPDRASPILVLGDSHVLVFHDGGDMHATGAGLPDQLAFELKAPVDTLGVRGSGATPARVSLARRARANSSYLSNKRVIMWCFGARELTQADAWKRVPLFKDTGTNIP